MEGLVANARSHTAAALRVSAIRAGFASLERFPFNCRHAAQSSFQRQLIVPFGDSGYGALFEIVDASTVAITAVRHQLEDDDHRPQRGHHASWAQVFSASS